jgi:hypothetical protein
MLYNFVMESGGDREAVDGPTSAHKPSRVGDSER